jgi:transcription-repair coupling factor (superfamily II helicase)
MESPDPMDRLLVGDVGYGKTEVAIRAAFKAVQGGKQVAVLVPTTILAQQHYRSFVARMTGFPVKVSVLSRFSTKGEQQKVLLDVEEGRTDIVIGTARMLQKDVCFKDLGLIVVDEEHRFGVLSKEKLKISRESVDVLMLSATPIPRTLALSLRGMRSISVLNDPPRNRVPLLTSAGAWSTDIVRKAIMREIERGGQVFYVTNRVSRIEKSTALIRSLFPKVVIESAHGRMSEKELERVMFGFYQGTVQILVCTTIVESGLDVPGANTIIVENCQEIGLAQMYQLRGRVGRRDESAFAYFLYPEGQPLSRETLERLDAITTLNTGEGYDLALQDLRIRGSGDLLGTAQHGSEGRVTDAYLYYTVLEEEIGKLRGGQPAAATIHADIPCLVPSSYIPQESIRIALYRRLLRLDHMDTLATFSREMEDRFGRIPDELRNLMNISLLRVSGGAYGITTIDINRKETVIQGSTRLLEELKKMQFWYRMGEKVVGPGGGGGLSQLVHALRRMKTGEVS